MKKTLSLLCLTAVILTVALATRGDQPQPKERHAVVVLHAYEAAENGPVYIGDLVYVSSSSAGAPTFPQFTGDPSKLTPLADAIASLLDAGFKIQHVSDNALCYTFTR